MNQGIINIIVALLTIIGALVAAWVGNVLGRRTERRKKIRESLEEIYKLSNQVNVWVQVTLRFLYKEIDKTDYYRVVIPGEYLEDYAKEPECPSERLEMLISFDAPSLKMYLPAYMFIVSELREVRYIYETHKSKDTLDYYFGGITFSEYEKMSGRQVNSTEEFLEYVTVKFPDLHDKLRNALNRLAQRN